MEKEESLGWSERTQSALARASKEHWGETDGPSIQQERLLSAATGAPKAVAGLVFASSALGLALSWSELGTGGLVLWAMGSLWLSILLGGSCGVGISFLILGGSGRSALSLALKMLRIGLGFSAVVGLCFGPMLAEHCFGLLRNKLDDREEKGEGVWRALAFRSALWCEKGRVWARDVLDRGLMGRAMKKGDALVLLTEEAFERAAGAAGPLAGFYLARKRSVYSMKEVANAWESSPFDPGWRLRGMGEIDGEAEGEAEGKMRSLIELCKESLKLGRIGSEICALDANMLERALEAAILSREIGSDLDSVCEPARRGIRAL